MPKISLFKSLFLVIFGFLILIFAARFMPTILMSIFDNGFSNKHSSAFENMRKAGLDKDNDIAKEVRDALGNDPDKIEEFKYAWNINKLSPDEIWDYKKTPFLGVVNWVELDSRFVSITITSPNSSPFIGKQLNMGTQCTKENSYIELYDYAYIYNNTHDFFDAVDPGVTVLSYCLNEDCTEMGRICKIFAKAWGWEEEYLQEADINE